MAVKRVSKTTQGSCAYCTRPSTNKILANNKTYCSKLCAAMGLIAEVDKEDDICVDTHYFCFDQLFEAFFNEGPIPIPIKVRWSDAAENIQEPAPEGFVFVPIFIDDEQGTPDWVPTGGTAFVLNQDTVDEVVERLMH
jgi:hypothetical protein